MCSASGVWAEPQPKLNFVHFSLKIWDLLATHQRFSWESTDQISCKISKFYTECGNTCSQKHWIATASKTVKDNINRLQFYSRWMISQFSSVVSWCTRCLVWGRGALTVGVWSQNWGVLEGLRGCKISLSICNANANSSEATKFQNSIFSPLKMPPRAQCRPGQM